MDNFGVFKLLGSLYNAFNKQNKSQSEQTVKNFQENEDTSPVDRLKSDKKQTFAPLQNNMLNLIKNHDEFVNRVKDKNKTI